MQYMLSIDRQRHVKVSFSTADYRVPITWRKQQVNEHTYCGYTEMLIQLGVWFNIFSIIINIMQTIIIIIIIIII